MITDERLQEIETRASAATAGLETREDWDYYQAGRYLGVEPYHYVNGVEREGRPTGDPDRCYFRRDIFRVEHDGKGADQDFALHARQDVLDLVAEVKRLRAELQEIRDREDDMRARAKESE